MKFELQHTDTLTSARAGVLTTDHGPIETPVFMPVGTVGSVKAVFPVICGLVYCFLVYVYSYDVCVALLS